jgi:hypothetical protein
VNSHRVTYNGRQRKLEPKRGAKLSEEVRKEQRVSGNDHVGAMIRNETRKASSDKGIKQPSGAAASLGAIKRRVPSVVNLNVRPAHSAVDGSGLTQDRDP